MIDLDYLAHCLSTEMLDNLSFYLALSLSLEIVDAPPPLLYRDSPAFGDVVQFCFYLALCLPLEIDDNLSLYLPLRFSQEIEYIISISII